MLSSRGGALLLGPDRLEIPSHRAPALRRDALVGDALLGGGVVRGEDLSVRRGRLRAAAEAVDGLDGAGALRDLRGRADRALGGERIAVGPVAIGDVGAGASADLVGVGLAGHAHRGEARQDGAAESARALAALPLLAA